MGNTTCAYLGPNSSTCKCNEGFIIQGGGASFNCVPETPRQSQSTDAGAIAGGVAAGVVIVVILVGLVLVIIKRRQQAPQRGRVPKSRVPTVNKEHATPPNNNIALHSSSNDNSDDDESIPRTVSIVYTTPGVAQNKESIDAWVTSGYELKASQRKEAALSSQITTSTETIIPIDYVNSDAYKLQSNHSKIPQVDGQLTYDTVVAWAEVDESTQQNTTTTTPQYANYPRKPDLVPPQDYGNLIKPDASDYGGFLTQAPVVASTSGYANLPHKEHTYGNTADTKRTLVIQKPALRAGQTTHDEDV